MNPNFHLIRFDGTLDISRYPEFRAAFEELPRSAPVLVDLVGAEAADSIFLSEMLMAKRRHEAPFAVLIAPSGSVSRLFELTGLDAKMNVYHDLSAAVESLQAGRGQDNLNVGDGGSSSRISQ